MDKMDEVDGIDGRMDGTDGWMDGWDGWMDGTDEIDEIDG